MSPHAPIHSGRQALRHVLAHRQPDDTVWSHMGIVYETYHGKGTEPLMQHDFPTVLELAKGKRVWVVAGDDRPDFAEQLEAAGWTVTHENHSYGLNVLLAVPVGGGR